MSEARFVFRPVVLIVMALILGAARSLPAERIGERLRVQKLDNGLTALYVRRVNAPVFAAVICVNVGSSDEGAGYTGLAHLFEHMAFKGTRWIGTRDYEREKTILDAIEKTGAWINEEEHRLHPDEKRLAALREKMKELHKQQIPLIVKDEFDAIYKRFGGNDLNATTGNDFTTYYVELPNNAFELWAAMESQRLMAPVLREFYSERDVVTEERRMRADNQPFGKLFERFMASAFIAHPYRTPVIGWESDIRNLTMDRARWFYSRYYIPSNMVVAIVGDVDFDAASPIVARYFGRIPTAPAPPRVATREPDQNGRRRVAVEFDAEPQFVMGWHKPALPSEDDAALEILGEILGGGRSSRLEKKIVQEKQLARSLWVWSSAPGEKYDNLFVISAEPRHPHTAVEAQAGILEEIDALRSKLVADREIQRVRNQIDAETVRKLASNLGLARELAYYLCLTGDKDYIDTRLDTLRRVKAEDLRRVVGKYLTPEGLTIANIEKAEK